jgi:hypothetical protein
LVERLSEHPEGTFNEVCPTAAEKKGAYRFFANEQVEAEAIRAGHQDSTWRRMGSFERVLVVQDTTYLSSCPSEIAFFRDAAAGRAAPAPGD